VCYLSPRCGSNLIIEHNGHIFSCDHFVYPAYRLGNILANDLRELVLSKQQIASAHQKKPHFLNIAVAAMSFLRVGVDAPDTALPNRPMGTLD